MPFGKNVENAAQLTLTSCTVTCPGPVSTRSADSLVRHGVPVLELCLKWRCADDSQLLQLLQQLASAEGWSQLKPELTSPGSPSPAQKVRHVPQGGSLQIIKESHDGLVFEPHSSIWHLEYYRRLVVRHKTLLKSGPVQIALCSCIVSKLATHDAPKEAAGDAVACFGAALLTATARLTRRQDAGVSSFGIRTLIPSRTRDSSVDHAFDTSNMCRLVQFAFGRNRDHPKCAQPSAIYAV